GFMTLRDPPNAGSQLGQGSGASGINNAGQVVGFSVDANNVSHGFLLTHGQYTTLDDPNAGTGIFSFTAAGGINNRGQIVCSYAASPGATRFLPGNGPYTTPDDADAPPRGCTQAKGINNRGQVVGGSLDANIAFHGFVLSNGQYTTLDDGSVGTVALGINDRG